jgi:hypothetical protein
MAHGLTALRSRSFVVGGRAKHDHDTRFEESVQASGDGANVTPSRQGKIDGQIF